MPTMSVTELLLIAMLIIFTIPYLSWRIFKMQYYAPLVVIQIVAGILLGPGVLGAVLPDYYRFIFHPQVVQALNGIAWMGRDGLRVGRRYRVGFERSMGQSRRD